MKIFITLDQNKRIVSLRSGPYEVTDMNENEIDVSGLNTDKPLLYALYDSKTNKLSYDAEYETFHNPPVNNTPTYS